MQCFEWALWLLKSSIEAAVGTKAHAWLLKDFISIKSTIKQESAMSIWFYERFVAVNPQRRIFLTDFTMMLVKNPTDDQPANKITLKVPWGKYSLNCD